LEKQEMEELASDEDEENENENVENKVQEVENNYSY
jgi:hypothetical protein